jgi:hypothetical protein
MKRSVGTALALGIAVTTCGSPEENGAQATELSHSECTTSEWSRLLALDTLALQRGEALPPLHGASQGTDGVMFSDNRGAVRVVRVVFYGETGRATYVLYLGLENTLVAFVEQLSYEGTFMDEDKGVSSLIRQYLYMCQEKVVSPEGLPRPAEIESLLDELDL